MADGGGSRPGPAVSRVSLGDTGLRVTKYGLGAARLRPPDDHDPSTVDRALDIIHTALELGVRYIDTAPLYGRGDSEQLVGRALAEHPLSKEVVVTTKVGLYPEELDLTADAAIASVRQSMVRTRRQHLDLVQVHELKPDTVESILSPGGVVTGLEDLKKRGLIRHIGFTTSTVGCAVRALRDGRFDVAMLWRRADLLDDALLTAALPLARRKGVAVVVAAPLAAGLLAGDEAGLTRRNPSPEVRQALGMLQELCRDHEVPLAAAAMQFPLRHTGVTAVVAGAQAPEHVRQHLRWLDTPLSETFWNDLRLLRSR